MNDLVAPNLAARAIRLHANDNVVVARVDLCRSAHTHV